MGAALGVVTRGVQIGGRAAKGDTAFWALFCPETSKFGQVMPINLCPSVFCMKFNFNCLLFVFGGAVLCLGVESVKT